MECVVPFTVLSRAQYFLERGRRNLDCQVLISALTW